jgi:DNA-binding MarR family transcriptional regulator
MSALLVGYARCSTDQQDLTAQRDGLLGLGVEAERIYVDHGLTGTNRERPGLREALAACRASGDHVDLVLEQWHAERPDMDVSPMAIIGRLSIASRLIDAELAQTFATHGLDAASFDVLATLLRAGSPYELTPTQLMRSAMITSGAITQRLDRLEARGLIARTPNTRDGRGVLATLTTAGRATIDRALPDHLQTEHRLLTGLTLQQREDLERTLHQLIEALSGPGDNAGQ